MDHVLLAQWTLLTPEEHRKSESGLCLQTWHCFRVSAGLTLVRVGVWAYAPHRDDVGLSSHPLHPAVELLTRGPSTMLSASGRELEELSDLHSPQHFHGSRTPVRLLSARLAFRGRHQNTYELKAAGTNGDELQGGLQQKSVPLSQAMSVLKAAVNMDGAEVLLFANAGPSLNPPWVWETLALLSIEIGPEVPNALAPEAAIAHPRW